MIRLNQEACSELKNASAREWLETNGIGGFASSTITCLNTRRYHGLLVAALSHPLGRMLLLAKLEETLVIGDRRFDLSANQFSDVIYPQGHLYLKEFRLDPFPVFTYEVEGIEIIKSVFMIYGENTTVVQYEIHGASGEPVDCFLEARPLIAFRSHHSTTHENPSLNPHIQIEESLVSVAPYDGLPALYFAHDADSVEASGYWYRNFSYQAERERGLDFEEDLFNPLAFKFDLSLRSEVSIIASTERREVGKAVEYRGAEIERREAIVAAAPVADELVRSLVAAADQYVVARGDSKTVIAGYHWFDDRVRDTMIALPGLTLVTGRADVAQSALREFALQIDRGLLPDRLADATLWYFEAVRALLDYTGDYEFVKENLYAALAEIIDRHARGTRHGIRVDSDGLLDSCEEGARHGKAVEIQALWYNALRIAEDIAGKLSDDANEKRFAAMAARAKRSFNDLFWYDEAECLFDVVSGDMRDGSIRPNQIFAVSLPHTMLTREKARQVVRVIERELLTTLGLRSLAPGDHHYIGRYEGDTRHRDEAYHRGAVWAWLMGPFITAYIKVNNQSANKANRARARAAEMLAAFSRHLSDAGLGHVSEIFDGEIPYTPRGCIAQASSVAELLRAAVEDVFNIKPAKRESAITIE